MTNKTGHDVRRALLISALLAAIAAPAGANAQAAATQVDEIVVTGSRLRRDNFEAPIPLASISADQIQRSGQLSLGELIMDMSMLGAGVNQQTTSGTSFLQGQARADLRGLGASRTLTLMDGRRVVASDASSPAVDLNLIPTLMVERIDIVPGSASAVYGSEAIAGVVNVIMRKNVQGLRMDAQAGVSQEGDGEEYRLGALYGARLADDRLNVLVGAEFSHSGAIKQRDRDWASPGVRRSTTSPQTVLPNSRTNQSPFATFQLGTNYAVALDVRNPSVVTRLSPECSTAVVAATCQDAALVYATDYGLLQGRVDRGVVRGYADYKVSDKITAFGEASYSRVRGYSSLSPTFSAANGGGLLAVTLAGDNAFLNGPGDTASQLRAQFGLAGRPLTSATQVLVAKYFGEFGGRDTDSQRNNLRLVGGMNGDLDIAARTVHWDWYAEYGRFDGRVISSGIGNIARIRQAVDAVNVNGQVVCRNPAAQAAGCVPWDLVNGPSALAVSWANGVSVSTEKAEQKVAAVNASTDLFNLPAGPVRLAVGAEARREESAFVQDALGASGALFFNAVGARTGSYNVKEAYAELRIPLLKDLPLFNLLAIEGAGRIADYSTVGHANQYRVAVEWRPVRDIQLRANQGTAVRAPNIVELYAPQTVTSATGLVDPCDRTIFAGATAAQQAARRVTCAALISNYNPATFVSNIGSGRPNASVRTGGNPNLGAETAHTYGIGAAVRPRWIPDLQVSVDWFKYDIENGVGAVPLATLLQQLCYDSSADARSNPYCAQAPRDASGGIIEVGAVALNVSRVRIEGYDAAVAYRFRTADHFGADYGDLSLRLDATWTYRWGLQALPGQAYTQLANSVTNGTPEWKGQGSIAWSKADWQVQWTSHYIGSMISNVALQPSQLSPYRTGAYVMHDLRAQVRLNAQTEFRAGLLNVANRKPPQLPETFAATATGSSFYDNRGRFLYVGVSLTY